MTEGDLLLLHEKKDSWESYDSNLITAASRAAWTGI